MDLPVWCRKPCYSVYSKMFNCNLTEMDNQDLRQYKNLSEFFRRGLKPNARTVDNYSCLVSNSLKVTQSQGYLSKISFRLARAMEKFCISDK